MSYLVTRWGAHSHNMQWHTQSRQWSITYVMINSTQSISLELIALHGHLPFLPIFNDYIRQNRSTDLKNIFQSDPRGHGFLKILITSSWHLTIEVSHNFPTILKEWTGLWDPRIRSCYQFDKNGFPLFYVSRSHWLHCELAMANVDVNTKAVNLSKFKKEVLVALPMHPQNV